MKLSKTQLTPHDNYTTLTPPPVGTYRFNHDLKDNIPTGLRDLQQWVNWKWGKERSGKPAKIPCDANGIAVDAKDTLITFEQATANLNNKKIAGIGFYPQGAGIVGLDFDSCLDEVGTPMFDVGEYISRLDTYTEKSPSGRGVRMFVYGSLPDNVKDKFVEMYTHDRFLTVTGNVINDKPIRNGEATQAILDELYSKYKPVKPETEPATPVESMTSRPFVLLPDSEILKRLSADDPKWHRVLNGDYGDYVGHSEAILAICNKLAFYLDRDATLIAEFLRQHGTPSEKWGAKRNNTTWLGYTIDKAISDCKEVYTGKTKTKPTKAESTVGGFPESPSRLTDEHFLSICERLGYKFALNQLDNAIEFMNKQLRDTDVDIIQNEILKTYGLNPTDKKISALINIVSDSNSYHPIKRYLESLTWDGVDHIAELATYFTDDHDLISYSDGSVKSVFHAWLFRWLVGAVGKIYDPVYCQNPMMVIDGGQGDGKSTFVYWLCPDDKWFSLEQIQPDNKDHQIALTRTWIWEAGELGSVTRRADIDALKSFLTKSSVTARNPFERRPITKPALTSFIGTLNNISGFLNDPTGNRRFRPVKVTKLSWDYQNVDKNQVWAQAYHLYKSGVTNKLSPEETIVHTQLCGDNSVTDIVDDYVASWYEYTGNDNDYIASKDIHHHLTTYSDSNINLTSNKIASAMKKIGVGKATQKRLAGSPNPVRVFTGVKMTANHPVNRPNTINTIRSK